MPQILGPARFRPVYSRDPETGVRQIELYVDDELVAGVKEGYGWWPDPSIVSIGYLRAEGIAPADATDDEICDELAEMLNVKLVQWRNPDEPGYRGCPECPHAAEVHGIHGCRSCNCTATGA